MIARLRRVALLSAAVLQASMITSATMRVAIAADPVAETQPAPETQPALIPAPPKPARPDKLAGLDTPEGTLGYALGLRIGGRIAADFKAQGTAVDPTSLARGLADAVLGAPPLLPEETLARSLATFDERMQQKEKRFLEELAVKARDNKAAAARFLAANARKRGIQSLPSGLQYEIVKAADGPRPRPEQTVMIRASGRRLDGTALGDGGDAQEPAPCRISEEIRGWQEALVLMPAGSKWRLFIPPELAYGERGWPPLVGPNELLVFDLELVSISENP